MRKLTARQFNRTVSRLRLRFALACCPLGHQLPKHCPDELGRGGHGALAILLGQRVLARSDLAAESLCRPLGLIERDVAEASIPLERELELLHILSNAPKNTRRVCQAEISHPPRPKLDSRVLDAILGDNAAFINAVPPSIDI